MNGYYDTGLLLKLYTAEPESPAVQAFVHSRAQSLQITEQPCRLRRHRAALAHRRSQSAATMRPCAAL